MPYRGSPARGGANPGFQVGDVVQYSSDTRGQWLHARVERLHADNTLALSVTTPSGVVERRADSTQVRPRDQGPDSPIRKEVGRDTLERTIPETRPPLLVKVAPDLTDADITDIAAVAMTGAVDGLIATNTTITRPETLRNPLRNEAGGLSGKPLKDLATRVVADFHAATEGRVPIVGVGGVASGADAYAKIRAGASLVQIYSGMVFEGPSLAGRICRSLAGLLKRDGFEHVADAVGADHK